MLGFRATRERGRSFRDREHFLRESCGVMGVPYICNVIAAAKGPEAEGPEEDRAVTTEPERGERTHPRARSAPRDDPPSISPSLPWLTPVLGSGSLPSEQRPPQVDPQDTRRAVVDRLAEMRLPTSDEGVLAEEMVDAFLESLIADRRRPDRRPEGEASDSPPVATADDLTSEFVFAVALLTGYYHRVKAIGPDSLSRWGSDEATLRVGSGAEGGGDEGREIEVTLLVDVRERLRAVLRGSDRHPRLREIVEVLGSVLSSLTPPDGSAPKLSSTHLRVLTEYVWHLLNGDSPTYHGWTELLFELSLRTKLHPDRQGLPRPSLVNLREAAKAVRSAYEPVTAAAWARMAETPAYSSDLHGSVANLLRAQAELRRVGKTAQSPPVASAYVTTFDLELEMALFAAREPFVIALPVHVFSRGEEDVASLCWLGCVVRPEPDPKFPLGEQLRLLRAPEDWFVLSNQHYFRMDERSKLPVVVRLSGSPLMDLPNLQEHPSLLSGLEQLFHSTLAPGSGSDVTKTGEAASGWIKGISHAVLLDEYAALQQTAMEGFGLPTANKDERPSFGLPEVVGAGTEVLDRYWLLLGVQLRDSGIRYRLASQIGRATSPDRPRVRRNGAVVNRHLDGALEDLLYWYGFDVVREEHCHEFAPHLQHLVEHLGQPGLTVRYDETCPLDGGGGFR